MKRYHKKIYFPADQHEKLIALTYKLNGLRWRYSKHCLDNVKLRALDLEQLLYWIKTEARLDHEYIFEYYTDYIGNILKVCYRLPYNKHVDIILVVGSDKTLVTIYYNSADDKHYTLKRELYATAS